MKTLSPTRSCITSARAAGVDSAVTTAKHGWNKVWRVEHTLHSKYGDIEANFDGHGIAKSLVVVDIEATSGGRSIRTLHCKVVVDSL